MTTQIHRISDKAPEFPCWLWHEGTWRWIRHEAFPHHDLLHNAYTHWHPDQPSAPTATPPTEQATEGGVTTERDVRCHVAAVAEGETQGKSRAELDVGFAEFRRELNEAKADVLRGIQRDAARLVEDTARAGELATLRQSIARLTEERDQARQDLEERCAENDRERAAHLQAYQEAVKERDAAIANHIAAQSKLTALRSISEGEATKP